MSETHTEQLERVRVMAHFPQDCSLELGREDFDALKSVLSRVESLERTLSGIAITLGLETWEDLPVGDSKAILRAVERALNAHSLASFVRGQRAARVADGVDPDALPEVELLTRDKILGAAKVLERAEDQGACTISQNAAGPCIGGCNTFVGKDAHITEEGIRCGKCCSCGRVAKPVRQKEAVGV